MSERAIIQTEEERIVDAPLGTLKLNVMGEAAWTIASTSLTASSYAPGYERQDPELVEYNGGRETSTYCSDVGNDDIGHFPFIFGESVDEEFASFVGSESG